MHLVVVIHVGLDWSRPDFSNATCTYKVSIPDDVKDSMFTHCLIWCDLAAGAHGCALCWCMIRQQIITSGHLHSLIPPLALKSLQHCFLTLVSPLASVLLTLTDVSIPIVKFGVLWKRCSSSCDVK